MKKSEWNDKQLEDLLKQLPKIQDDRDPYDIYQNISRKQRKKRHKWWVMPSVTSISVILVMILSTNLIDPDTKKEKTEEGSMDSSTTEQMGKMPNKELNRVFVDEVQPNKEETSSLTAMDTEWSYSAVYEEDIEGNEVLTFAIPDQQEENIVPISVLVPQNAQKSKVELFLETMDRLTEEKWGLDDYYPLIGEFSYVEEQNELRVDVPIDHPYRAEAEEMFQNVLLSEHDSLEIDKISLFTEGKVGIQFDTNRWVNSFQMDQKKKHAYYLFFPKVASSEPYLIPYEQDFGNILEALDAMKNNIQSLGLKASIPSMMEFKLINESDKTLTLYLNNPSSMENNQSTIYTIEAILLTAKDFNFDAVQIENALIPNVGKFILDNEVKVPIAVNKQMIE
jgi:hypothetical protein